MTGTVEQVNANTRQWKSESYGAFEVDYVTVEGVSYEYNRPENKKALEVGQQIEFTPDKNKWGKDKMSGVKVVVQSRPQEGIAGQRQLAQSPAPVQVNKTSGIDVRMSALDSALHYYTTFKKGIIEPEGILKVASYFEKWVLKGDVTEPSNEVQNNTAPAAPEVTSNHGDSDDLPF